MSLSGELSIIGSEPGSGYPRAILTNNGTLLAIYRWSNGTDTTQIVTKTSNDLGATWSGPVEVISWDATKGDLNNPTLLQTSSGTLLCAYLLRLVASDHSTWEFVFNVHQSDDGAQSWYKIGNILTTKPGNGVQGEWEPFLRETADGTLQAYYSHELSDSDQDLVFRTSTNGGKTWSSDLVTVAGAGNTTIRPGMVQVLNIDGDKNNLMMAYENNEDSAPPFRVWAQTSSDGGNTWVNPHVIYDATANGGSAGGPGLTQIPGLLVVSFMTNEDNPKDSKTNMKVITSGDGGATWSPPLTAIVNAGWGGVTAVDGGVVVLGATPDPAASAVMQKVTF